MSVVNKILAIGFLAVISAYIVYFGAIAGLSAIILAETLLLAVLVGLLAKQRLGALPSSIIYIILLIAMIGASTSVTGLIAQHIYTGILLAADIILALLTVGFMKS